MPEAWRCCWAACHGAGQAGLARGCPRVSRQCCPRRRSHRRSRAQARSNRPGNVSNAMRQQERGAAYLDEVLALGLGHQRLQLGCGEGVDEARLGHDEQQHLGAR